MEKFTIIVPIYNAEKYINKCIDSILAQTYKNIEIILVNDGSTDNSLEICKEYKKKDKRIKVFNQKNSGVSQARNKGIDNATGELIIFVDSDDWIDADMIEQLEKVYERFKPDLINYKIYGRKKEYQDKQYLTKEDSLEKIIDMIRKEQLNSPVDKVYKLEHIKKYNIKFTDKIEIGEDLLFNFDYIKNINTLYIFEKELYHVEEIVNMNSLTKKYIYNKYEQLIYVNNTMIKWAKEIENNDLNEALKYIRLKNISSCFISLFHKDCKLDRKSKIKYIIKVKAKNKRIVLKNSKKIYFLGSIVYTYSIPCILYYIYKIIAANKKNKIRIKIKNIGDKDGS